MKRVLVILALLWPSVALADDAASGAWQRFTDPTDGAFSLDVPAGWTVMGGVVHRQDATTAWMSAASPDGSIRISIGDPEEFSLSGPKGSSSEGLEAARQYGLARLERLRICDHPRIIAPVSLPQPVVAGQSVGNAPSTGEAFFYCIDRHYAGYAAANARRQGDKAMMADPVSLIVAPIEDLPAALLRLQHMARSWSAPDEFAGEMAGRSAWQRQVDQDHAVGLGQIAKLTEAGAAICEASPRMPYRHHCQPDEQVGTP